MMIVPTTGYVSFDNVLVVCNVSSDDYDTTSVARYMETYEGAWIARC
jgi:hypothetical protein